jgi:excisionase family DNA binding protein
LSTNFRDGDSDFSDWISQAEAARIHGVSRQAINKLIRNRRLRTFEAGGHTLVSRKEVESFAPKPAGRPKTGLSPEVERIKAMIGSLPVEGQIEVFKYTRDLLPLHPFETRIGASVEVILEALHRSEELIVRMFRGILAEAAFATHLATLADWQSQTVVANAAYDFLVKDQIGSIRVQVKLQRSKKGSPVKTERTSQKYLPGYYQVEPQKTRSGNDRQGNPTRPYKFGEFDILAVAMQPTTGNWNSFLYTVADWLIPNPRNESELAKLQPVAPEVDDDWTDNFNTCADWLRSGVKKRIRGVVKR